MNYKNPTAKFLIRSMPLSIIIFFQSCRAPALSRDQSRDITDSVKKTIDLIASDLKSAGPIAWLKYFESDSGYFMASEGKLVFPNYDFASRFIKNKLVKSISKIELTWTDVRVDPLTGNFANIAAGFHEDLTDFNDETVHEDGYFTAVTEHTSSGWKLRNAHWSVINK